MIYVRDERRYTLNQLKKMGVQDPLNSGFKVLQNIVPEYNRFTHKIVDSGDTLDGAIVYSILELTLVEQKAMMDDYAKEIIAEVDKKIDQVIVTIKGYTTRDSIAKYLIVGLPFYEECKAMSEWIAACYVHCFTIQTQVAQGEISLPTVQEILDGLPVPTFLTESELETLNKKNNLFSTFVM